MLRLLSRLLLMLTLVANGSVSAWAMPNASSGNGHDCAHASPSAPTVHGHHEHASNDAAEIAGDPIPSHARADCCNQAVCSCGSLLPAALPSVRIAGSMPAPASLPAGAPALLRGNGRDSPPLRPPAG